MLVSLLLGLLRNALSLLVLPFRLLRRARACPEGGWVHLEIDGPLIELRRPLSRLPWKRRGASGVPLDRLRALVDAMLEDPAPAGLLVTVKSLAASAAFRTTLRAELARLRDRGRPVVVYLPSGGSSGELLVASGASRVLVGAQSTLGPLGFHIGSLYLRGALDKAGIVPDVHAEGTYKTAGENFARESMSGPQREQLGRILDVLHDELCEGLSEARRVPVDIARAWIDRGLIDADEAVAVGLADASVHDDEVLHFLGSQRSEGKAKTVGAGRYLNRRTARLFRPLRPRPIVALIEAHGAIVEKAPVHIGSFCEAERLVGLLRHVEEDHRVLGVVLHLDSPGGGVLASEKIHRAVSRVAAKKPVVALFGGVSASGGYYIASACHAIVARPTTITGSIGVVAARVLAGPLLERLGIHPDGVTRGVHADMLSMTRPFSDDEKKIFEAELDRAYRHFLDIVAAGRRKKPEEIRPLAGGRVWMGKDALSNGLVDRLGGLPEALAEVRERAGASARHAEPVLFEPKHRFEAPHLLDLLPGMSASVPALAPLLEAAPLLLSGRERVLLLCTAGRPS